MSRVVLVIEMTEMKEAVVRFLYTCAFLKGGVSPARSGGKIQREH